MALLAIRLAYSGHILTIRFRLAEKRLQVGAFACITQAAAEQIKKQSDWDTSNKDADLHGVGVIEEDLIVKENKHHGYFHRSWYSLIVEGKGMKIRGPDGFRGPDGHGPWMPPFTEDEAKILGFENEQHWNERYNTTGNGICAQKWNEIEDVAADPADPEKTQKKILVCLIHAVSI
eukprot:SAG31_NODE_5241_length_2656_cov_1.481424_1_plen_176_part_00